MAEAKAIAPIFFDMNSFKLLFTQPKAIIIPIFFGMYCRFGVVNAPSGD